MTSSRPGQRASRRPARDGGLDPVGSLARLLALQPQQKQRDGDGRIVELECAGQVQFEAAKIMISELEIEMLPGGRDGLVVDADFVANEQRGAAGSAIILDEMRPQVPAVLAIDDRAAGGAGVALVGYDQFKRIAEQFDMLVIDRGDAGLARADETDRIVASADAGLEHRKVAFAVLEVQAGKREQRFERAELLAHALRDGCDGGFDPRFQAGERVVVDLDAVDLNPFVETKEMRRGEEAGPQAIGAADAGAHRRRTALAVRAGHHHRNALQPRAIDCERVQQFGHAREADAVAVFRQVEHYSSPMAEKV